MRSMKSRANKQLQDGTGCKIIRGTHAGKSGVVKDIKTSKTGHITITVLQANGERFKTLARNVAIR
jgi:ribosomal protein S4E